MTIASLTAVKQASSAIPAQDLKAIITSNISSYFSSTLGTEEKIAEIVLALCQKESSFRNTVFGPPVTSGSGYMDYYNSTVIKNVLANGSQPQKDNVAQGYRAIGVMQVMGWNFVKGASVKNGVCEIQRLRSDLSDTLCVSPGDNIQAKIMGSSTILAVLAGLTLLEGKWKAVKRTAQGWSSGSYVYPSRISAAVSAYLGSGASDVLGTTPQAYASSIVGGAAYALANNGSSAGLTGSVYQTSTKASGGPVITIASGGNKGPDGCLTKAMV